MSESVVFTRRDFLRLAGIGVAATASGCAKAPAEKLIPYLVPPDDMLPGIAYWYSSTCRECPSGCGIRVKTREGRAIKIEGNPDHPMNRGGLCARGQAALQGLYDPDRVRSPLIREGTSWKKIGWDEALRTASERIAQARTAGRGIALVTDHAPGSFEKLAARWASAAGGTHLVHEPFAPTALREANRRTFGQAAVPFHDFGRARFVISFGADFLETWGSPVAYSRGFAEMRAREGGSFVAVEPRLSLTGANADEWVAIRPGGELALALGMAHVILSENLGPGADRGALLEAVSTYTPDAVTQQTDVPADTVRQLARRFAAARPGLAVAGGVASQSEQAVAMLAAVNLLNVVAGNVGETVRFDRTLNVDAVAPLSELQRLASGMADGSVGALVVHGANPVYSVPGWAKFPAAMDRVPFKLAISATLDDTVERCDMVLPSTHPLESLGDAETSRGVYSIVQPTMQHVPTFDARPAGDTLIALAKGAGFGAAFPDTWTEFVKQEWRPLHQRFGGGADFETFWTRTLQNGGVWEDVGGGGGARWSGAPVFATPQFHGGGDLTLVLFPTIAMHDGRGANKSWLQELPDPTTKAVWGSWVEIHPETAKRIGVGMGDAVRVETEAGSVELPAYLYGGIRKDTIAVPLGQGHAAYGRYAKDRGVNALSLLPPAQDQASGTLAYLSARARISKGTQPVELVRTQRQMRQHEREVARIIPLSEITSPGGAATAHHGAGGHAAPAPGANGHAEHFVDPQMESPMQRKPGKHTEPLQRPSDYKPPAHAVSAFVPEEQVRSARTNPVDVGSYKNANHRWAMAIDLNVCTGCSACMVACSAENNVPVVGPEMIKRGREMWWIRIERYEEAIGSGRNDVRFVPMMCQHCGDAPCEIVCPVYATYHNPEGLNAQIYNRCVGTRYCSNNCPYKVRAFNWFDYAAPEKPTFAFPEPLNWQLNPDVTVRSKGVMEKCTMCVQRILDAKGTAKDEQRPIRDGEFQTACQQTCPTQAIVFGDLLDRDSKVAKLSYGERAYWVLDELNTKPGVTYLKRIRNDAV